MNKTHNFIVTYFSDKVALGNKPELLYNFKQTCNKKMYNLFYNFVTWFLFFFYIIKTVN